MCNRNGTAVFVIINHVIKKKKTIYFTDKAMKEPPKICEQFI